MCWEIRVLKAFSVVGEILNAWITIISMDIRIVVTVLTRSMIDSRLYKCRVDILSSAF